MRRPTFDERDAEILAARAASLMVNPLNVGDFVTFKNGVTRRVSYIWGEPGVPESVQTCDHGSFYLGDGYVSMSGALYHGVPFSTLTNTGDMHNGRVWFFHHDYACADNGVEVEAKFRIWHCNLDAEEC